MPRLAQNYECPKCGAAPGMPCTIVTPRTRGTKGSMRRPDDIGAVAFKDHPERIEKWEQIEDIVRVRRDGQWLRVPRSEVKNTDEVLN